MPSRHRREPLIIIQWSCDPLPDKTIPKDTIIDKRLHVDAQGLKNAQVLWRYLKLQKPKKRKTVHKLTKIMNEDFSVIRTNKNNIDNYTQQFFEYYKMPDNKLKDMLKKRDSFKVGKRPTITPNKFLRALQHGTIVYLPIHGGHALDDHDIYDTEYELPQNVYVISFNPPNSHILLLDQTPMQEFLTFLTNPDALTIIAKDHMRSKLFESEFFKQFRIWGNKDIIINRGLVTDRGYDLMIRPSKEKTFRYMKKSWLRNTSGVDIHSLYDELSNTYCPKHHKKAETSQSTR